MEAIRIKKRIESETLKLPVPKKMIGKNVEIIFLLDPESEEKEENTTNEKSISRFFGSGRTNAAPRRSFRKFAPTGNETFARKKSNYEKKDVSSRHGYCNLLVERRSPPNRRKNKRIGAGKRIDFLDHGCGALFRSIQFHKEGRKCSDSRRADSRASYHSIR